MFDHIAWTGVEDTCADRLDAGGRGCRDGLVPDVVGDRCFRGVWGRGVGGGEGGVWSSSVREGGRA